jgi:adenylosuccinate synthase
MDDAVAGRVRELGQEYGTVTGRGRRPGWLDLVALRYAVRLNGLTGLVVTKLDVLTGIDPIRVAVRYVGVGSEGRSFEDFPYHQSVLHKARGETIDLPGWHEDISAVRRIDDLPAPARGYLDLIEERLDIPVVMVGVGPARDEMIWTDAAERLRPAAA